MVNLLDLTVSYLRQKRLFHIEPNVSIDDIFFLIGNYFRIQPSQFLLEIIDERFDLLIALDNAYLDELRSDLYFSVNKSLSAQIRLRHRLSSNIQVDINYLSANILLESNIFFSFYIKNQCTLIH
jgi:hypothetical protein